MSIKNEAKYCVYIRKDKKIGKIKVGYSLFRDLHHQVCRQQKYEIEDIICLWESKVEIFARRAKANIKRNVARYRGLSRVENRDTIICSTDILEKICNTNYRSIKKVPDSEIRTKFIESKTERQKYDRKRNR